MSGLTDFISEDMSLFFDGMDLKEDVRYIYILTDFISEDMSHFFDGKV